MVGDRGIRETRPGDPLSADQQNRIRDAIMANADKKGREFPQVEHLPVFITGAEGTANWYEWAEASWNPAAAEFQTLTNGRTQATARHAFDVSGVAALPSPANPVVVLTQRLDLEDPDGDPGWEFDGSAYNEFLAKVTGWALVGGSDTRWKYAWTKVELDGDGDAVVTGAAALSGTTSVNYGLNLAEMNNGTSATVHSNGPVGGGSGGTPDIEAVVVMRMVVDAAGARRFVFGDIEVFGWGKATAPWAGAATVTLNPCDANGNDNGQANVVVYLRSDKAAPKAADIETNDIIGYVPFGSTWLATGWPQLPAGTGRYKVLALDGSNNAWWDWVRAH